MLEILAIVALFLLRLGVPVALTILVTWWLRRLDAKWQAEASSALTPAAPVAGQPQPARVTERRPCWEVRNCPEERRSQCPAFFAPEVACWLARLRAGQRLPDACGDCGLYRSAQRLVAAGD
jgi:hypothetical protein